MLPGCHPDQGRSHTSEGRIHSAFCILHLGAAHCPSVTRPKDAFILHSSLQKRQHRCPFCFSSSFAYSSGTFTR